MLYTRRDVGRIALASIPSAALAAPTSKSSGVQIGAITYSFRSMSNLDDILKAYTEIGLSECEIMSTHAEAAAGMPAPAGRGGAGAAAATAKKGGEGKKGPAGGGGRAPARTARPPMTEEQIVAARERGKEQLAWRKSVSMDKYKAIAKKFEDAGVDIRLVCYNMNEAVTDDEIEYAFQMTKALGA